MPTDATAVAGSKRELYTSLSMVWLFILILLGDSMTDPQRWNEVLLFIVAFLYAVVYAVKAARSRTA